MEDYYIRYADMPPSVKAYTVLQDGFYTIVLNSRLCREMNVMSFEHEINHINKDDFIKDDVSKIESETHNNDKRQ